MKLTLQRIDEFTRPDHYYLEQRDSCFFYGEYTARKGYSHSTTNNLILNFKKSLKKKNGPEWIYKARAIEAVSEVLVNLQAWEQLQHFTWIPIPPSKQKADPLYDNRLLETLDLVKESHANMDVRELVTIKSSRTAAHDTDERPSPEKHYNNFQIDQS